MKVLLVRPPSILGFISKENIQHPINLAQLAAELLAEGVFTQIIDYELEKYSDEAFAAKIREFKPNLIGFSAVTPHITKCANMARLAKSVTPEVMTVVGGHHSSVLPAQTLREFPSFDLVVIGEGELTLVRLCRALENKENLEILKGIAFRQNGEITVNLPVELIADLDELHMPARHILRLKDYFQINRFKGVSSPGISRRGINPTQIFTSKGCWGKCTFCSNDTVFGNPALPSKVRFRSFESIAAEVERCILDFGINHFSIEDEVFPVNKELLSSMCELFTKHKVTWNCNSRIDILRREDLNLMAQSGCLKLELGVESGSPRILSLIKKEIILSQVEDSFAWAKEAGIWRTAYLMIGSHPDENISDLMLTKKFIKKIKPDLITFTIAVPYPGTELYRQMKRHDLLTTENWEDFQYYNRIPSWRTFNMTAEELVKQQKKILRWFYMHPSFILHKFTQIK